MTIQAHDINTDLLPPRLQELAELVGIDNALVLAETYPGQQLFIPWRANPGHRLAQLVGLDALVALAREFGGTELYIPKAVTRQLKHELVRQLRKNGNTAQAVGSALGYTHRRVQQITSASIETDQQDLFGEES